MSRLRWWIARRLDRSRSRCWVDLVSWALRYDGYSLRDRDGKRCAMTDCYCGKFKAKEPIR